MKFGENCRNCRFWNREQTECRRNPPLAVLNQEPIRSSLEVVRGQPNEVRLSVLPFWPRTSADQWCGSFEENYLGSPLRVNKLEGQWEAERERERGQGLFCAQ